MPNPTEQEKFEKFWNDNPHLDGSEKKAAKAAWLARAEIAGEEKKALQDRVTELGEDIQNMRPALELIQQVGFCECDTEGEPCLFCRATETLESLSKAHPQSTEADGGREG